LKARNAAFALCGRGTDVVRSLKKLPNVGCRSGGGAECAPRIGETLARYALHHGDLFNRQACYSYIIGDLESGAPGKS
jgi:hypothetical protein